MAGEGIGIGMVDTQFLSRRIGRYDILERIGKGGMAQVYRALDTNLDRVVAVKVLYEHLSDDPTFKERFEREAKFVASFNHPNIVQVYDFDSFTKDGTTNYYMVMSYIAGHNLREELEQHQKQDRLMDHQRVLQIASNVADALHYAHERGMVHRDVKPANILFDEREQAILTDFGIARLIATSNLTQEGMTVGTPAYMSPEQVAGEMVDARSDIYALGIITYEMFAGRPPFPDDGSVSVLLKHLNEPVQSLAEITHLPHQAVDAVVLRALSKDPKERYQTAKAFADDLLAAFQGIAIAAPVRVRTSQSGAVTLPAASERGATSQQVTRATLSLQQVTQQIQTITRSPAGILVVGVAVIALLLLLSVVNNALRTAPSASGEVESMTGADSMTGTFYFSSTFDAADTTRDLWQADSIPLLLREFSASGLYRIDNQRPGRAVTSLFTPDYRYSDVSISMTATLEPESTPTSGYGVVFRYTDENNYNVFAVDGTGRFSIWTRSEGVWRELRELPGEDWTTSSSVKRIGLPNVLTIDVIGSRMIGYVNGNKVTEVSDDTLTEGRVGVYLASSSGGSASVLVDSFGVADVTESMTDSMTEEDGSPDIDGR